jgi:hypothetical protein
MTPEVGIGDVCQIPDVRVAARGREENAAIGLPSYVGTTPAEVATAAEVRSSPSARAAGLVAP